MGPIPSLVILYVIFNFQVVLKCICIRLPVQSIRDAHDVRYSWSIIVENRWASTANVSAIWDEHKQKWIINFKLKILSRYVMPVVFTRLRDLPTTWWSISISDNFKKYKFFKITISWLKKNDAWNEISYNPIIDKRNPLIIIITKLLHRQAWELRSRMYIYIYTSIYCFLSPRSFWIITHTYSFSSSSVGYSKDSLLLFSQIIYTNDRQSLHTRNTIINIYKGTWTINIEIDELAY